MAAVAAGYKLIAPSGDINLVKVDRILDEDIIVHVL